MSNINRFDFTFERIATRLKRFVTSLYFPCPTESYIITGKLKVYFNDGDTDTIDDYEVRVKAKDLWLYRQGALMQDAFPYLQPMDREFLMTGTWLGNDLDDEEEDDTDDGSWEGR